MGIFWGRANSTDKLGQANLTSWGSAFKRPKREAFGPIITSHWTFSMGSIPKNIDHHLEVSWNEGTPRSSSFNRIFHEINQLFLDTTIYGNHHWYSLGWGRQHHLSETPRWDRAWRHGIRDQTRGTAKPWNFQALAARLPKPRLKIQTNDERIVQWIHILQTLQVTNNLKLDCWTGFSTWWFSAESMTKWPNLKRSPTSWPRASHHISITRW